MDRKFYFSHSLVTRLGVVSARVAFIILAAIYLLAAPAATAAADDESNQKLDCISCHQKTLTFHDKLGPGNKSCWSCHDGIDMKSLHLIDGTPLQLPESSQLCGQCHEKRYDAWQEGTHGVPGTIAAGTCSDCHDPHQPQIALLGITEPHPEPAPAASQPNFDLMMIAIITLLLLTGLGIIVVRQGRGS